MRERKERLVVEEELEDGRWVKEEKFTKEEIEGKGKGDKEEGKDKKG